MVKSYSKIELAAISIYLERVRERSDVNAPYKPRKVLQDPEHKALRDAYKDRPASKKQKDAERQAKWSDQNKDALKRRAKVVREQRKNMGLDKTSTES